MAACRITWQMQYLYEKQDIYCVTVIQQHFLDHLWKTCFTVFMYTNTKVLVRCRQAATLLPPVFCNSPLRKHPELYLAFSVPYVLNCSETSKFFCFFRVLPIHIQIFSLLVAVVFFVFFSSVCTRFMDLINGTCFPTDFCCSINHCYTSKKKPPTFFQSAQIHLC